MESESCVQCGLSILGRTAIAMTKDTITHAKLFNLIFVIGQSRHTLSHIARMTRLGEINPSQAAKMCNAEIRKINQANK